MRHFSTQVMELKLPTHSLLAEFGVSMPLKTMHQLPNTRVLPAPELCYGGSNDNQNAGKKGRVIPSDGVWDMWGSNVKFYVPKDVISWAVVGVGLRNPLQKYQK